VMCRRDCRQVHERLSVPTPTRTPCAGSAPGTTRPGEWIRVRTLDMSSSICVVGATPSSCSSMSRKSGVCRRRLDDVAFGQVDAHNRAVRALPQWFRPHSGIGCLHGLAVAPLTHQFVGQHFEGMQPQPTKTLTFQQHPVVVPPRKQLPPSASSGGITPSTTTFGSSTRCAQSLNSRISTRGRAGSHLRSIRE
jgi:hypothetical protein